MSRAFPRLTLLHRPWPRTGPQNTYGWRVDYLSYSFMVSEDGLTRSLPGALYVLRQERRRGVAKMREKAGWGVALKLRRVNVERDYLTPSLLKVTLIAEGYRITA